MFRKQPHSSKWSGKTNSQAYPLTLADMDYALYEPFKQKLVDQITNLNNLTYKDRSEQYFDALLSWYRKHHSVELSRQFFVECPSICNLIACCIMAFAKYQQKVLVFTPVYSFYMKSIQNLNRIPVACQLKEAPANDVNPAQFHLYRYQFDLNQFRIMMDQQKPRLIILCHPHNPSGKIFTKWQLDFIVKKAEQHNAYILSDEIMGDFTLFPYPVKDNKKSFVSLSTFTYDKIIVGNSISKIFNCESVQGGYGIIRNETTRKQYQKISSAFKLLTNQLSLMLTPIVYTKDGQMWISMLNSIIHDNFKLLKQASTFSKFIKIYDLESSYLTTIEFVFPQKGKSIVTNKYLAEVLASFKIYFTDMEDYFYPKTNRNVFRISIAVHPDEFRKFLTQFKKCVEELTKMFSQKSIKEDLTEIRKSKL